MTELLVDAANSDELLEAETLLEGITALPHANEPACTDQCLEGAAEFQEKSAASVPVDSAKQGSRFTPAELERIAKGVDGRIFYAAIKRLLDVAFSLVVLIGLSPLYILIALAVWIDDPHGSSLFFQERVGKHGKTFKMVKFRSMYTDAEDRLDELMDANEKDGPVFKIKKDPRITRVGKFIRKTSLDELPQFWNVLVGDMSIVGPRPALPREVRQYSLHDQLRLVVRPGITCYWQTRRNRDSITFDEWVNLDLLYILKAGLWTDFKLIIQTVGCVLTFQGE